MDYTQYLLAIWDKLADINESMGTQLTALLQLEQSIQQLQESISMVGLGVLVLIGVGLALIWATVWSK